MANRAHLHDCNDDLGAAAGAPIFERTATTGLPRQDASAAASVRIVTLGCRLNAFESEVMRQHATAAGLTNAAIVNTCAVTGEAVRQAAQTIRKLRREDSLSLASLSRAVPRKSILVGLGAMTEVDAVIGNAEKMLPGTFQGRER